MWSQSTRSVSSSETRLIGVDHPCCKGRGRLHEDLVIELHLMLVQVVLHIGCDGLRVCCTATAAYKYLHHRHIDRHDKLKSRDAALPREQYTGGAHHLRTSRSAHIICQLRELVRHSVRNVVARGGSGICSEDHPSIEGHRHDRGLQSTDFHEGAEQYAVAACMWRHAQDLMRQAWHDVDGRCTYPHGHFAFSELILKGFGMHSEVLHVRESLFYPTLLCAMHQQDDLECSGRLWSPQALKYCSALPQMNCIYLTQSTCPIERMLLTSEGLALAQLPHHFTTL